MIAWVRSVSLTYSIKLWALPERRVLSQIGSSIVDSTDVKAKVDTFKIKDTPDASPDKDARHGYKSRKKPFFGYKAHVSMDSDSELIAKEGEAEDRAKIRRA